MSASGILKVEGRQPKGNVGGCAQSGGVSGPASPPAGTAAAAGVASLAAHDL